MPLVAATAQRRDGCCQVETGKGMGGERREYRGCDGRIDGRVDLADLFREVAGAREQAEHQIELRRFFLEAPPSVPTAPTFSTHAARPPGLTGRVRHGAQAWVECDAGCPQPLYGR